MGLCPLPSFLSKKKLSLNSHLDARQFSTSLYTTGDFQAVPQCWSSEGVSLGKSMCEFFKGNCLGLQKFHSLAQYPLGFTVRNYGDLSSWHWNPGLRSLVWSWDSSLLRHPSQIFIHHTGMQDHPFRISAPSTSLHGCGFFSSVVVRSTPLNFCQFRVVVVLQFSCDFDVVVRGSELCLPVPPSRPGVLFFNF